ncbi:MAG: hypothetical protein ABI888_04110 [Chloroflexota bacterium]
MTTARNELNTLEASGLVQVATLEPELEYLFRHALVQDAAYSSLLKQDRRTLHRLAADTVLALYPDRRRELAAVIGMHYERAGDMAAAAEHFVVAGEQALERFANKDALAFFDRAEASFPPDDDRLELRIRAAIGGARVSWTFRGADDSIGRLERTLPVAEGHGDLKLLGDMYFWIAFMRRVRGENPVTSPELKHVLDRAREIGVARGDPAADALPDAFMAVGLMFGGDLREGTRALEEALELLGSGGDAVSATILHGLLSLGHSRLGNFAAAEQALTKASAFAANGDPIGALDVDITRSGLFVERGDIAEGEALATSCAARSEELGALACAVPANIITGAAHLARNDALGAKAPLERGEELANVASMGSFQTLAEGMLSAVRARLGDVPGATAGWTVALERAGATHDRYGEAITRWQRANATPADPGASIADLDVAAQLFEEMHARPSLARVLRDLAKLLRTTGRTADGDAADARSRTLAAELGLKDFPAG